MSASDCLWFLIIGLAIFTLILWDSENDRLKKDGIKISLFSFLKTKVRMLTIKIIELKISRWFLISTIALIVFALGIAVFALMLRYDYATEMNKIYKIDRFTGSTYILQRFYNGRDLPDGGVANGIQFRWIQVTPKTSKEFRD